MTPRRNYSITVSMVFFTNLILKKVQIGNNFVQVLPAFLGCANVAAHSQKMITTGRSLLQAPSSVSLKKKNATCVVTWENRNIDSEVEDVWVSYSLSESSPILKKRSLRAELFFRSWLKILFPFCARHQLKTILLHLSRCVFLSLQ